MLRALLFVIAALTASAQQAESSAALSMVERGNQLAIDHRDSVPSGWFTYAAIIDPRGTDTALERVARYGKDGPGYKKIYSRGDLFLDAAIGFLARGESGQASRILERAKALPAGDFWNFAPLVSLVELGLKSDALMILDKVLADEGKKSGDASMRQTEEAALVFSLAGWPDRAFSQSAGLDQSEYESLVRGLVERRKYSIALEFMGRASASQGVFLCRHLSEILRRNEDPVVLQLASDQVVKRCVGATAWSASWIIPVSSKLGASQLAAFESKLENAGALGQLQLAQLHQYLGDTSAARRIVAGIAGHLSEGIVSVRNFERSSGVWREAELVTQYLAETHEIAASLGMKSEATAVANALVELLDNSSQKRDQSPSEYPRDWLIFSLDCGTPAEWVSAMDDADNGLANGLRARAANDAPKLRGRDRLVCLQNLADAAKSGDEGTRLSLAKEALQEARSMTNPDDRRFALGMVADMSPTIGLKLVAIAEGRMDLSIPDGATNAAADADIDRVLAAVEAHSKNERYSGLDEYCSDALSALAEGGHAKAFDKTVRVCTDSLNSGDGLFKSDEIIGFLTKTGQFARAIDFADNFRVAPRQKLFAQIARAFVVAERPELDTILGR